ncbi:MAG TPA: PsbP-related protein [Patescibacteria group bacterium]
METNDQSHKFVFFAPKVLRSIIGVLLFIVVVGSVAWYKTIKETPKMSQQVVTNPTAGWKTYSNDQYGFAFKYPNDWTLTDISNGSRNVFPPTFTGVNLRKNGSDKDIIGIDFFSADEDLLQGSSFGADPSTDAKIGGVSWKAIKFSDCSPGSCPPHDSLSITTKNNNNNKYYQITLYPNDTANINPIFTSILDTFKFSEKIVPITGTLQGTATNGSLINIDVYSPSKNAHNGGRTDSSGHYNVKVLPGVYEIYYFRDGESSKNKYFVKSVTVKAGQTVNLNFNVDTSTLLTMDF